MKKVSFIIAMFIMISINLTSQNSTNYYDAYGQKVGYSQPDPFDDGRLNIYNKFGVLVGYTSTNIFGGTVDVYSANGVKIGAYDSQQQIGNSAPNFYELFKPIEYEPKKIKESERTSENIRKAEFDAEVKKMLDAQADEYKEKRQQQDEYYNYLRDSIIRSRQEFFDTPKAQVPFKLVINGTEYYLTTRYVECSSPKMDEQVKGLMWCHNFDGKVTGFWMKNPVRGSDFYEIKK